MHLFSKRKPSSASDSRHVKRTPNRARITSINQNLPNSTVIQLRNCRDVVGFDASCVNSTDSSAWNTSLPSTNSNNTAVVANPPNPSINKANTTNLDSSSVASNKTITSPPTVTQRTNRLGWIIGLVSALAVCLVLIGLAIRCRVIQNRRRRKKREYLSSNDEFEGKRQVEKEKVTALPTIPKPILKSKSFNKSQSNPSFCDIERNGDSDESGLQEILSLENNNSSQNKPFKRKNESENRSRKSSLMERLSLKSFGLKPSVDMFIFEARTDPPLDTFQLEMKHRERSSNLP